MSYALVALACVSAAALANAYWQLLSRYAPPDEPEPKARRRRGATLPDE